MHLLKQNGSKLKREVGRLSQPIKIFGVKSSQDAFKPVDHGKSGHSLAKLPVPGESFGMSLFEGLNGNPLAGIVRALALFPTAICSHVSLESPIDRISFPYRWIVESDGR